MQVCKLCYSGLQTYLTLFLYSKRVKVDSGMSLRIIWQHLLYFHVLLLLVICLYLTYSFSNAICYWFIHLALSVTLSVIGLYFIRSFSYAIRLSGCLFVCHISRFIFRHYLLPGHLLHKIIQNKTKEIVGQMKV